MTSTERIAVLSDLASKVAHYLGAEWGFTPETDPGWSVFIEGNNRQRIYFSLLSSVGYGKNDRVNISGSLNVGKNNSFVTVYENNQRLTAGEITVALARGPEAIAKEITRRFLTEYSRVYRLALAKVQADADYEAKTTANLLRLAKVAGVTFHSDDNLNYRGEVRKDFTLKIGTAYHDVRVNDHEADLKLQDLTFEQAEHIIRYLRGDHNDK